MKFTIATKNKKSYNFKCNIIKSLVFEGYL